jgi:hypothetical protein
MTPNLSVPSGWMGCHASGVSGTSKGAVVARTIEIFFLILHLSLSISLRVIYRGVLVLWNSLPLGA